MTLTPEQREALDRMADHFLIGSHADALRAALADLDAATAALRPVADHLRTLRGKYAGAKRSDLTYIFSPAQVDAVLAAVGKDR